MPGGALIGCKGSLLRAAEYMAIWYRLRGDPRCPNAILPISNRQRVAILRRASQQTNGGESCINKEKHSPDSRSQASRSVALSSAYPRAYKVQRWRER